MAFDITNAVFTVANLLSGGSFKDAITRPNGGEIYRIWFDNDDSGKCYVGQTIQGSLNRIRQHVEDAQSKDGDGCPLLDAATRRFGLQHMRYEILEQGIETHEELDMAEKYWIAKFDSQEPNGYNVKSGGQGKVSFTPIGTKATGKKISHKLGASNPLAAALIESFTSRATVPVAVRETLSKIL